MWGILRYHKVTKIERNTFALYIYIYIFIFQMVMTRREPWTEVSGSLNGEYVVFKDAP